MRKCVGRRDPQRPFGSGIGAIWLCSLGPSPRHKGLNLLKSGPSREREHPSAQLPIGGLPREMSK